MAQVSRMVQKTRAGDSSRGARMKRMLFPFVDSAFYDYQNGQVTFVVNGEALRFSDNGKLFALVACR